MGRGMGMGMRMVLRVTGGSLCDLMAHKVVAKPIMCVSVC